MKNCKLIITRVVVAGVAIFMTAHAVSSANPKSVHGVVQTGGTSSSQPLPNVHVTYSKRQRDSRQSWARRLQMLRVDSAFVTREAPHRVSSLCKQTLAKVWSSSLSLAQTCPTSVTINELTTVAASYSMAQFLRTGVISGNSFGLQIAAGMNDNIVVSATGQSSPVLLNSPNADQTNSLRSTRSLANLLAACVNDPAVTASLFDLTTPAGGLPPNNTAEALANLARDPGTERRMGSTS